MLHQILLSSSGHFNPRKKSSHDYFSQSTKSGTWAGTQTLTQKQTCPRACLVPLLPGHPLPRWTHTFNSNYQDEGRTHNREFAAMLADEYILNFISLSAHIQPTEFYQLLLLSSSSVFQSAAAPGRTLKNTSTAASPAVVAYFFSFPTGTLSFHRHRYIQA